MPIERTHLSPRMICQSLGVGIDAVLSWIHTGQLKASNISNSPLRPRWCVAKADLDSFLSARSNQPKAKKANRGYPLKEFV